MKKLLTIACTAMAATAFAAQPLLSVKSEYIITMPQEYGYQGASCLQLCPDNIENGEILIYDEELNQIANIQLAGAKEVELKRWYQPMYESGEWGSVSEYFTNSSFMSYADIESSCNGIEFNWCAVTQTVFNSDSNFEYVVPKQKIITYTYVRDTERGGGEDIVTTGFSIMSQTGTKLFDIDIPAAYHASQYEAVNIITMSDKNPKRYLSFRVQDDNDEEYRFIYALDGLGGISAPKIVSTGMKVSPRTPRRGETVSVELGEATSRVDLISANGAKVRSVAANGASTVNIPTQGLPAGVYVVSANNREAAKIIIR